MNEDNNKNSYNIDEDPKFNEGAADLAHDFDNTTIEQDMAEQSLQTALENQIAVINEMTNKEELAFHIEDITGIILDLEAKKKVSDAALRLAVNPDFGLVFNEAFTSSSLQGLVQERLSIQLDIRNPDTLTHAKALDERVCSVLAAATELNTFMTLAQASGEAAGPELEYAKGVMDAYKGRLIELGG
jgi:hypothetical protein